MRHLVLALMVCVLLPAAGAQERERPKPRAVEVAGCVQAGVEAGCVMLLTAEGKKYHLLGEKLPQPGTFVHVKGTAGVEVISYCMEGEPLEVRTARVIEKRCPRGEGREEK